MAKKIIAVIPVRLGSKRLPRKHLRIVSGKPLLSWMIERQIVAFRRLMPIDVVIASTVEPENAELRQFAQSLGVEIFFGDIDNIPLRLLQAAEAFGAHGMVAIDGDDIASSPQASLGVAGLLQAGFPHVTTSGLPFGINASGFLTSALRDALASHPESKLSTGWGRIFNSSQTVSLAFPTDSLEGVERLRFTLDYEEDLRFFTEVLGRTAGEFVNYSDRQLMDLVIAHQLYAINQKVHESYWQNFRSEMALESASN